MGLNEFEKALANVPAKFDTTKSPEHKEHVEQKQQEFLEKHTVTKEAVGMLQHAQEDEKEA